MSQIPQQFDRFLKDLKGCLNNLLSNENLSDMVRLQCKGLYADLTMHRMEDWDLTNVGFKGAAPNPAQPVQATLPVAQPTQPQSSEPPYVLPSKEKKRLWPFNRNKKEPDAADSTSLEPKVPESRPEPKVPEPRSEQKSKEPKAFQEPKPAVFTPPTSTTIAPEDDGEIYEEFEDVGDDDMLPPPPPQSKPDLPCAKGFLTPTKKGFLEKKKDGFFGSNKTVYCVLDGKTFYYYADEDAATPKDYFSVDGQEIIKEINNKKLASFEVTVQDKVFNFIGSHVEIEDWATKLSEASTGTIAATTTKYEPTPPAGDELEEETYTDVEAVQSCFDMPPANPPSAKQTQPALPSMRKTSKAAPTVYKPPAQVPPVTNGDADDGGETYVDVDFPGDGDGDDIYHDVDNPAVEDTNKPTPPSKPAPKAPTGNGVTITKSHLTAEKLDNQYLVKWQYYARTPNELTVNRHETVIFLKESTKDWWEVDHNGEIGLVPKSYLKKANQRA